MRVDFSNLNPSNTLRKPLIIVEGYDVSRTLSDIQDNYSIADFISAIDAPFDAGYDFNQQLDNIGGYDLIFIDFNNGTDDIVRNAALVQEVINRVNANKVNDDRFGNIRQQNVILGLSMGGLCARYALANMTKNFPTTPSETRLLVTHDSPHRGANVPLGAQYLIRMIGEAELFGTDIRDIYPQYNQVVGLLAEPATQQLLMYRSITANTMTTNTFLDAAYRDMITFSPTDPQPAYRFVATSNGSECANQLFSPGTNLINVSLDGFLFYFPIISYRIQTIAKFNALPNTGSNSEIARFKLNSKFKLFGLITISKDFYNNIAYAPGSQFPIDGVPGGLNPLAGTDIEVPNISAIIPLPGLFNILGYVSVNSSGTPANFTFVPLVSALDVAPYDNASFTQPFVSGFNALYPSASATFIAQETAGSVSNNTHIRFTARNSRWIFNEMEGNPNTENCSSECTPNQSWTITGPNFVCDIPVLFSVNNIPAGATVVWNVGSRLNIINSSSNGAQITVQRIGTLSGYSALTATIFLGPAQCALNSNPVLLKNVRVGAPDANSFVPYITQGGNTTFMSKFCNKLTSICDGQVPLGKGYIAPPETNVISQFNYCASGYITDANATSITWSMVQRSPGTFHGYYNFTGNQFNVGINLNYPLEWVVLRCTRTNECGSATSDYRFYAGNGICIGEIEELSNPAEGAKNSSIENVVVEVYPNPSFGALKVSLLDKEQKSTIKKIIISNKMGLNIYNQTFNNNQSFQNLQIKVPATDIYSIHVFNGYQWVVQKISLLRN